MPLFSELDPEAQNRVLQGYDQRIVSLMEGQAKLRERRRTVILSSAEDLEIEAGLLRLQAAIDDLLDEKAALKLSAKSVPVPTAAELQALRDKVAAIHDLNVASKRTSAIIAAIEEIAGSLPNA